MAGIAVLSRRLVLPASRAGQASLLTVTNVPLGSRHLLPGDVKRAVSRDGHRSPYRGDNFAKIHSGLVVDAGAKPQRPIVR
jgi:hypothetical protein